jgi:CheY-like chemotaxis protein
MSTLAENIPAKTGVAPSRFPGNPAHRVLVVEDNADVRELNVQALALAGYQVEGAEDGVAGWQLLDGGNFDLLITDNEMPKMSGLELIKQVRSAGMTLPIIMATGRLPEEELERLTRCRRSSRTNGPGLKEKAVRQCRVSHGLTCRHACGD